MRRFGYLLGAAILSPAYSGLAGIINSGRNGLNTQIIGRIAIVSMSQRQCSIWRATGCPESKALLTLHNIGKMPPEIHRVVVTQLNTTRKGPGRSCGSLDLKCMCVLSLRRIPGS